MTKPALIEAPDTFTAPLDGWCVDYGTLRHYIISGVTRDGDKPLALHVTSANREGQRYRFTASGDWLYKTPADAWAAYVLEVDRSIENAKETIGKLEADLIDYNRQRDAALKEVLRLLGEDKTIEMLGKDATPRA